MTVTRPQLAAFAFLMVYAHSGPELALVTLLGASAAALMLVRVPLEPLLRMGVGPYLGVLTVAVISTLLVSPFPTNVYFIARDLFYFCSPPLMLVIGCALCRASPDPARLLWGLTITFTILSVIAFRDLWLAGAFLQISINNRYTYGLDGTYATMALVILVAAARSGARVASPQIWWAVLALNVYMLILSLSRTNLSIVAVVLALSMMRAGWQRLVVVGVVIAFATLPVLLGLLGQTLETIGQEVTFLDKLTRSFGEVAVRDYDSAAERNEFWRGYEAFLGIDAVRAQGWAGTLIGIGLGSFVEGPFLHKLNVIPLFHNGYVTVFVKAGLVGMVLFLWFLLRLGKGVSTAAPNASLWRQLTLVMTLSIALDTLSAHGVLWKWVPLELLILGIAHTALAPGRAWAGRRAGRRAGHRDGPRSKSLGSPWERAHDQAPPDI